MALRPRTPATLDLTLAIGRRHDLRLVERPGLRLDDEAFGRLMADLHAIADACVPGGSLRYGVLSGDRARLADAVIGIVYERSSGAPIGFNAMTWMQGPFEASGSGAVAEGENGRAGPAAVLHAGLCMIVPGARRGGLLGIMSAAPALLAFARNRLRPLWVTNVTQVPAVAGLFAGAVSRVYPAPGRAKPPSATHHRIAAGVMARHRHVFGVGAEAYFDAERFVIRNAYTGGSDDLKKSYEEAGKHRDPRINRLCQELLDYDRGDDLLQVGALTLGTFCSLAWSMVRRIVGSRRADRRAASREAEGVSTPEPPVTAVPPLRITVAVR
jgi:hypothetical protein